MFYSNQNLNNKNAMLVSLAEQLQVHKDNLSKPAYSSVKSFIEEPSFPRAVDSAFKLKKNSGVVDAILKRRDEINIKDSHYDDIATGTRPKGLSHWELDDNQMLDYYKNKLINFDNTYDVDALESVREFIPKCIDLINAIVS